MIVLAGYLLYTKYVTSPQKIVQQQEEGGTNDDERDREKGDVMMPERSPQKFACVGEYCDGSLDVDNPEDIYTILQIPLIINNEGPIGCGASIFFAPHTIEKTPAPLNAAYTLLFDIKAEPEIPEDGFRNVVGDYTQLFYDRVTLDKGLAKVYLTGALNVPGVCSPPELRAQIIQTALKFDTVSSVEVYVNDKLYDWCEQDQSGGEGSCPETPDYWKEVK